MNQMEYYMGSIFVTKLYLMALMCVVSRVLHVLCFHKSLHYHPCIQNRNTLILIDSRELCPYEI
jgi:hypothetical protein